MRALLVVLVVTVLGCPGPEQVDDCPRSLVSADGRVGLVGPGGGVGGGSGASTPMSALGLQDQPVEVSGFAPLTSCVSDAVRVEVEVLDPDLQPVAASLSPGPPRVAGVQGVTAQFTPRRGGVHTVRFVFEPSLGVRTVLVPVAGSALQRPFVRVPIACAPRDAWALADDAVACEASGQVAVTFSDGGVERFPGSQLVVAGPALWSFHAPSARLERRVYVDGGVAFTHSFPSVAATPTPGLHSETVALRTTTTGELVRLRVDPGLAPAFSYQVQLTEGPFWVEPDETLWVGSSLRCSPAAWLNAPELRALEPEVLWQGASSFSEQVEGTARPLVARPPPPPRYSLRFPTESLVQPTGGFERLPLWLSTDFGQGRRVLVSGDRGSLDFTAWPRDEVLRVGREHLLLKDPGGGFVRVVRK